MNWNILPENLNATSGRFAGDIADLSTRSWDKGLRRRLQRKAWVFAGAHNEQFSIGFAMADAGLVATAFIYIFDRKKGQLTEHKLTRPLGFTKDFSPTPKNSWALRQGKQQYHWSQPFDNQYVAEFSNTAITLKLVLTDNGRSISALNQPLSRPFQYTQKNIGVQTAVSLDMAGTAHEFETQHGVLDFSLGYPPRHAQWQWACLSGVTADGLPIGINAVAQYFNGLENAMWLADAVIPLPQVIFEYNREDILSDWHIKTADGRLNVKFTPEGRRQENINVGLLSSHFQQPFGHFIGQYESENGKSHNFSGFGVVEQHRAKW